MSETDPHTIRVVKEVELYTDNHCATYALFGYIMNGQWLPRVHIFMASRPIFKESDLPISKTLLNIMPKLLS